MIHIFNRKQLLATFNMEQQAKVRTLLHDNGIDYQVKTANRSGASVLSPNTRGRTGSLRNPMEDMYEYLIYVKKEDHERVAALIRSC